MSAHFKQPLVCECGHTGFRHLSEWGHWDSCKSYSLEGFEGGEVTIDKGVATVTGADGSVTRVAVSPASTSFRPCARSAPSADASALSKGRRHAYREGGQKPHR